MIDRMVKKKVANAIGRVVMCSGGGESSTNRKTITLVSAEACINIWGRRK